MISAKNDSRMIAELEYESERSEVHYRKPKKLAHDISDILNYDHNEKIETAEFYN